MTPAAAKAARGIARAPYEYEAYAPDNSYDPHPLCIERLAAQVPAGRRFPSAVPVSIPHPAKCAQSWRVTCSGAFGALSIVQEALANVQRHAEAQNCRARLVLTLDGDPGDFRPRYRGRRLIVEVVDDGLGLPSRTTRPAGLVAQGKTNAEIGEALHLSAKTVSNHVSNVLFKLQAADRAKLMLMAVEAGLGHRDCDARDH